MFCCLVLSNAVAQEQREYVSFVEEGKVWYCGHTHTIDEHFPHSLQNPCGWGIDCIFTMGVDQKNGKTISVLSLPFEDMVRDFIEDGIREVNVEEKADNNIYLPDGRRIAGKPQKGIYIQNGQKRVAR